MNALLEAARWRDKRECPGLYLPRQRSQSCVLTASGQSRKTTKDHVAMHSILKIDCMVNIITGNELRNPRPSETMF